MEGLNSFNIRNRLTFAFATCMIVFLSFGIFTILQIHRLTDVTQKIYEDPLKVSNAAIEARVDIIKVQKALRDLVLSENKEEIDEIVENIKVLEIKIIDSLEKITQQSKTEENRILLEEVRKTFLRWQNDYREIVDLILAEASGEALDIVKEYNHQYVSQIEESLMFIDSNAQNLANAFIQEGNEIEKHLRFLLILFMTILGSFLLIFFILIIRSIISPIVMLKTSMEHSIATGRLTKVQLQGKNEMTEIATFYNMLIQRLKDQFWVKDSQNALNREMSGIMDLDALAQKVLNFLARRLEAGKGVLYLYDNPTETLYAQTFFACTEKQQRCRKYQLGESIVGQVALDRKPILLKDIHREEDYIVTGMMEEAPLCIYAFPLIYQGELYGVIELGFFKAFDALKEEFLKKAGVMIAIHLNAVVQNQRIRDLLQFSEEAQKEAKNTAYELQKANAVLEEQQYTLQQQTAQLQQTNAELEEQQQLLQQQSEELQQTNVQLEEHQQLLEQKSTILNRRNQELQKSQEMLLKHSKALEEANKYKTEFLANMSHELRTPLNSVILLSRLLMKDEGIGLQEKQLERVEVIYHSGQELLRLINDILDLSKIEAGKMNIHRKKFHSKDLVRELRRLFEGMLAEKKLQFTIQDKIDDVLIGDCEKISQILRNFISNALKFTERGEVTLKMMEDEENGMVFSVTDTGIGIASDNLSKIFEAFQQEDGSISRKFGGTGLGLSISKKLAELMGGEIKVNSKVGEGSTFSLYLKNIMVADKEKPLYQQNKETAEECGATVDEISSDEVCYKTILIIEDDENFAGYIKTIIDKRGFKTLVASTGEEGLVYAKEYVVDGIILDLVLPDISGMEVLRELKSISELKHIPVHIISAWKKHHTPEKMGAIGYQEKPLNEENIIDILSKITAFGEKEKESHYLTPKTNKDHTLRLQGKKIMIVDDDPKNIFVLAAALEDYGGEILEADHGETALKKLREEKVDLILMDIMMPKMDGFEAIKAIRQNEALSDIPIIAITAKSLKGDQEKCIEAGANDYISKPVDYEVLIQLVKAWINK
ncbi:response regulator [Clostridium formicaceticum]|uniref:Circadian input-output histidine kinase CikA n=1 Tax=Clostridium formicaceticum TaxID=1497 RepID=A0AAC9RSH9_9CLOT|nr:response regulator [Clostridium formicaceticum]AOY74881.1 hypothetical protein BJL90_02260 [Clostridium formicaceticum]ARE89285.1 Signal transduction histidine-protein kinase BarA [Clostridium formicaceticum]